MISKEQIQHLKDRISGNETELLSLYAHMNPAEPNNHPKAIAVRARETLKTLGMPRELIEAVLAHLSNETKEARTVAIFAGADHFEVIEMAVDLPVVDPTTGHVEARWGAPHIAPLLLALDEHTRYGVVFADRERWRFFEVFLGEIDEVAQLFHPLSKEELTRLDQSRQVDRVAWRPDQAKSRSEEHVLAWTHRFYKDAAARIDKLVAARGIDRLILMGPDRDIHFLETLMPRALRDRVVALAHSLPTPNAGAHEVLKKIEPLITEIEAEKELELVRDIRERGVFGLEATLSALQNGQVYAVVMPWSSQLRVFVNRETGYAASAPDELHAMLGPDAVLQDKLLRDVLPDLAVASAARVELVRGDKAKNLLMHELGGIGGLKRWAEKKVPHDGDLGRKSRDETREEQRRLT